MATTRQMEAWIGVALRGGVVVAGAIMLLGLGLFLVVGPGAGPRSTVPDVLGAGAHPQPVSLAAIIAAVQAWNPVGLIQLGVLVLIATPVLRVALMLAFFVVRRDIVFVLISAIVLINLLMGLIGRFP